MGAVNVGKNGETVAFPTKSRVWPEWESKIMTKSILRDVRSSGGLLGLATALCVASTAVAQTASPAAAAPKPAADADSNNQPGEIIVTANKREERLNKVGLTVSVLSGKDLNERKITSLQDVAAVVPGLAFAPSVNNTPILTLRGVGFNESSLGVYPAVSVYVDQAPLPFPVLASHSAYDLERIEVLKGPQGTLFGQNSTGGAINYIAAKPTKVFAAGGDVSFGRFNQVEGNAYISGPLSNSFRARVAVTGLNSDGWQISDTRPTDRNGKQSYLAGRFLIDGDLGSAVHVALNVNGWHDTSQPQAAQFILLQPQTPSTVRPEELLVPFTSGNARAADWATGINTPRSDRKFYQIAFRADINVASDIQLTSLTSYDHFDQKQTSDNDGSALLISDLQEDNGRITSFNQELRLSNIAKSAFRWVLGANLEKSTTSELQWLAFLNDSNNSAPLNNFFQAVALNRQSIRNYAFFANGEYDLTPELTLKGAIRYTNTRDAATICAVDAGDGRLATLFNILGGVLGTTTFTPIGSTGPVAGRCYPLNAQNVPNRDEVKQALSQSNVSWRAGLDYRLNPEALLYINVSRGYKAGSFPILAAATTSQYTPVTQEAVTAYEGGVKASLMDRKVQFNSAVFYYKYADKQVLTKAVDPVFGVLDVLRNIPKSHVFGVEGDVVVKASPDLTLSGSLTYLEAKIDTYNGVDYIGANRNFAGQALPFAPRWNYGINAEYRHRLENGGAPFIGVSVNGHSKSDTVPGGSSITVAPAPTTRILPGLINPFVTKAYATVDGRIGYEGPDGRWRVMVWAKNLLNTYYWTNVVTTSDVSARYAGKPATYGLTVGFTM